jgi:hypothetical protein
VENTCKGILPPANRSFGNTAALELSFEEKRPAGKLSETTGRKQVSFQETGYRRNSERTDIQVKTTCKGKNTGISVSVNARSRSS